MFPLEVPPACADVVGAYVRCVRSQERGRCRGLWRRVKLCVNVPESAPVGFK